jgi:hypothetical protein
MTSPKSLTKAADDAPKTISDAARAATSAIAEAAAAAVKVLSAQAADKESILNSHILSTGGDHDLLVQLNTKMTGLKDDIAELKNGTSSRIQQLEAEKLNTRDSYPVLYKAGVEEKLLDHENRIRSAETNITRILTWGLAGIMLIGVVEFAISNFWNT